LIAGVVLDVKKYTHLQFSNCCVAIRVQ